LCVGLGMGGTILWENPHFTGATPAGTDSTDGAAA
jgi:acetyl-CoA acyltransferase